jgi:hypothetical protein
MGVHSAPPVAGELHVVVAAVAAVGRVNSVRERDEDW